MRLFKDKSQTLQIHQVAIKRNSNNKLCATKLEHNVKKVAILNVYLKNSHIDSHCREESKQNYVSNLSDWKISQL